MPKSKIVILNDIVVDLIGAYKWLTFMETDEVYVYDDGYWRNHRTRDIIETVVNAELGKKARQRDRNEVYYGIRSRTRIPMSLVKRNTSPTLINFQDGTYNLETGKFQKHDSNDYFFYIINPDVRIGLVDCPNIDKFFHEIVEKKGEPVEVTEAKVETLYQIIGYCLYRGLPIHKFVILVGEGSNGKSTYLKLIELFLGEDNISRVSLQQLAYNRFAPIRLFGKLANIHADIPAKKIKYTGVIKMLTGGDPMSGEKKFVQGELPFTNTAKLIFSCNKVPEVDDDTRAWFRRQLIIEFSNIFNDELGNVDKNIIEKLTTPEELTGLLNRSIEALKKLLKDGEFVYRKTTQEWAKEYTFRSNPIKAFSDTMLEDSANTRVPKRIVYQSYIDFCVKNKLPTTDPRVFWTKIREYINFVGSYIRENNRRIYCIDGIQLLDMNYINENRVLVTVQRELSES